MPYLSLEDNISIYYETYGKEKSYPIVLIHPLGGNIMIWKEEISLILKSGKYRVIAYELRGHYRSNMGNKNNFSMEDLANDLDKLLKHLKIFKCTLIGHSIGGKIAAVFAKKRMDILDAIIFISGSSIPIPEEDLEDSRMIEIALSEGMDAVAEFERLNKYKKEKAFQTEKYWNRFKEILTRTTVEGFIAARNSLRTMPEGINKFLKGSDCRLFAIVGSEDEVFLNLKIRMKKEIPRLKLKIINGEGHWLILHNPAELNKAIEVFLNEINIQSYS